VNDISALNNDNVLCGCFELYPSYVAGILQSVKEIHFFALCAKKINVDYTQLIERCIQGKEWTLTLGKLSKISFIALPDDQHFKLTCGDERVTVSFLTRLFHKLPSQVVFAERVNRLHPMQSSLGPNV